MLGGKDNFAADRELAERMCTIDPGLPGMARANRDFLTAAVRRAAQAGIGQFLDLGAGLPTRPAVHHTAREVNEPSPGSSHDLHIALTRPPPARGGVAWWARA